jgi:capsular exopolysaccharide synthesis family protein
MVRFPIGRAAAARRRAAELAAAQEAFRILRSNLGVAIAELDNRCVVVTSALEHEGKSSTSVAIAQSLAAAGSKVTLVDLDLRDPTVHTLTGATTDIGASDVLLGRLSLEDCLQQVTLPTEVGAAAVTLRLLAAGPAVANPTELLSSPAAVQLLGRLAASADIVVVDAPPVLPVADTLVLGGLAAGAVLVVEARRTAVQTVKQAKEMLAKSHVRLLGVVLNKFDPRYAFDTVDNVSVYGTRDDAKQSTTRPWGGRRGMLAAAAVAGALVAAVVVGAVAGDEDGTAAKAAPAATTSTTTTTVTTATSPPRAPEGTTWDGSARIFHGDRTLVYRGRAGSLRIRFGGDERLRVTAHGPDGDGPDLIVDEAGPYRGRVAIGHGPVTLVVDTRGGYWGAAVDGPASSG